MKNIIFSLLLVGSAMGCAHSPKTPKAEKTIVLIQGVHMDGKSWNEVRNRIPADQFNVMDLGRMGRDVENAKVSIKEIATLGCQAIPEKSILVGHSFGGAVSNTMFGICPEKILKIIYVSAVVPLKNETAFQRMSKKDSEAYGKAVSFGNNTITPADASTFFAATDQQVDLNSTLPRLYPESMNLAKETITFDNGRFKKLSKIYILTENDPVVSLKTQRSYVKAAAITQTGVVQTGHFPMISQPEALSQLILKWAQN